MTAEFIQLAQDLHGWHGRTYALLHPNTPNVLVVRGSPKRIQRAWYTMEEPAEGADPPYHFDCFSQREMRFVQLLLLLAETEADRKQILDSAGVTAEHFDEFFRSGTKFTGTDDD